MSRAEFGWQLSLPAGLAGTYRLAQLDDYGTLSRKDLLHPPLLTLRLRARVSAPDLPGTWGFGLWNDPFGFSLGFGGQKFRLPALPQAAWFFHASPPNWLSLGEDTLPGSDQAVPANGFFAGTFSSSGIPTLLLAPALAVFPLCAIRPFSRLLRKLARHFIRQDGRRVELDPAGWHEYSILWQHEGCIFRVDGEMILKTCITPKPPLGLVIWIDNQFAAWTPSGKLAFGTLENPAATMEISNLSVY